MGIFKQKSKCISALFCFALWLAFVASPQFAFANGFQEEGFQSDVTIEQAVTNEASDAEEVNSSSNNVVGTTTATEASKVNNENSAKEESNLTEADASQVNSQNSVRGDSTQTEAVATSTVSNSPSEEKNTSNDKATGVANVSSAVSEMSAISTTTASTNKQTSSNTSNSNDEPLDYEKPYSSVYAYDYYRNNNVDLQDVYANNRKKFLEHFLNYGMNEGRQGNESFDVTSYYNEYADLRSTYGTNLKKYYEHYIKYGQTEGRHATGCSSLKDYVTTYGGTDYSAVYDGSYYAINNTDVTKWATFGPDLVSDAKLIQHFLNYGMNEGRQGNESFDVTSYYNEYADLRSTYGTNLKKYYEHYIKYGQKEGRHTTGCNELKNPIVTWNKFDYSLVYDPFIYMKRNSDLEAYATCDTSSGTIIDDKKLIEHFIKYGANEARFANNTFDVISYYNQYSDLRRAYGNKMLSYYQHYCKNGKKEGRDAVGCGSLLDQIVTWAGRNWSAVYDAGFYMKNYTDMANLGTIKTGRGNLLNDGGLLSHFYNYGMKELRQAIATFSGRSYFNQYSDLRRAYGTNWKAYYTHYIDYGKREGRAGTGCSSLSGDLELDNILISIITSHSSLRSCFDYVAFDFSYRSGSKWPSGNWTPDFAKEMYYNGSGNCYRYAALFYWCARALGYSAGVQCGYVPSALGGGAPHGWVEIYDGDTYICDPDLQYEIGGDGWYMNTYAGARCDYWW